MPSHLRKTIIVLAVLTALHGIRSPGAAFVRAQQPAPFRVTTRLVQVSVIVTDRNRNPVSGLTASDFRLYDDGKEQRVELFSIESDSQATAGEVRSLPALAAGEFSNRIQKPGGVTVILFDRLNTRSDDQLFARGQLVKFLEQIRPADRVALYVLDGDMVRVLHDFTNDARSLVRALSRYRAMTSNELAASEAPVPETPETGDARLDAEMAAFLEAGNEKIAQHFRGVRSEATITALESVALRLAGVRGRKNLVWISSGYPLDSLTIYGKGQTVEINRAGRALNNANVAVYTVDARGLVGAFSSPPNARQQVFATLSTVRGNLDILEIVAEETGGRAFFNTNDINNAIRRAVDDARLTYVLGYYPSHGKWDGRHHAIRVSVNRPGVEVRHRKGYLAIPGQGEDTSQRSASLRAAILSPLEATGIGLTARVERVERAPTDATVTIGVDPTSITLERAADNWEGSLDVVVAQSSPDGSVVRSVDKTMTLRMTAERHAQIMKEGFSINATVAMLPDVARLTVVVRDGPTGSMGTLVVPGNKLSVRPN
jgi:VWFA-related protein